MFIYKIGRNVFEEDYYLAHETKFSQEEFDEMCEAAERTILSYPFAEGAERYEATYIRDHLIDNHGFKDLDEISICEFNKDGDIIGDDDTDE